MEKSSFNCMVRDGILPYILYFTLMNLSASYTLAGI